MNDTFLMCYKFCHVDTVHTITSKYDKCAYLETKYSFKVTRKCDIILMFTGDKEYNNRQRLGWYSVRLNKMFRLAD